MEIHQLNYFLAIAEQQSIAKASTLLHISQSALSVALKDLERELGFSLFDRKGGRLHLNGNGRYMEGQVRKALSLINNAQFVVSNNINQEQKVVKCATNMTLGEIGRVIICNYREEHPDVILRFGFKGSLTFKDTHPNVEFYGTEKELAEGDRTTKILQERFLLAFSADSPYASFPTVSLRDLQSEYFIMTGPGEMQETELGMFKEAGFFPRVFTEVQLYSEVLNLVRANMGYTIVPEYSWADNFDGLALKPFEDVHRQRNIYALLPEEGFPTTATMAFFDFLKRKHRKLFPFNQTDFHAVGTCAC